MADKIRSERISALPQDIFDELFRDDESELIQDLIKEHKLKKGTEDIIAELIRELFIKDISLEDFAPKIAKKISMSDELGRKIAVDIAKTRLLPHEDYFAGVGRQIVIWGGEPIKAEKIKPTSLPADAPKGREAKGAAPVAAPTAESAPAAAKSSFEQRAEVEEEAEILKKQKETAKITPVTQSIEDKLNEKIKAVVSEAKIVFANPALTKRFETIISARLRDVRDGAETKEMLLRADKVGGLGLGAAEAERVSQILNRVFAEFSGLYRKEEEAKRKAFLAEQAEREALRKAERERREREEREKLYARVTGVAPSITKLEVRSSKVEQVSVRPPASSFSRHKVGIPTEVSGQIPTTKPRMEEVKFTPKITGPVEELAQMTLIEFRRLSKDAKEAVLKIGDKIDLLEEEDFGKKVAGIKAWQGSGVNKLYLDLLKDGLNRGVGISAIIDEKAKGGAETLTKAEFDAIMELNRNLRF
ncbi:hypothetical protein HYT45_00825 [Candidatus Uhrbacteria bacterium]|nr:hypothetical protein [Candidatus Uhrbacteria bacterium]